MEKSRTASSARDPTLAFRTFGRKIQRDPAAIRTIPGTLDLFLFVTAEMEEDRVKNGDEDRPPDQEKLVFDPR